MAKPKVTATDQLANVIEVVQLGRRTGLLSVERGSGSVLEEGEIYFVAGRAIYASLAGLRGREALTTLSRWGPCRFTFDVTEPRPMPNIPAGPPPTQAPITGGPQAPPATNPAFSQSPPMTGTGSFGGPRQEYQSSFGQGQVPQGSGTWHLPQRGPNSPQRYNSGQGHDEFGAYGDTNGMTGGRYPGEGVPGTLDGRDLWRQVEPRPYPAPQNGTTGLAAGAPPAPTFLARRPRRAPDVRDLMTVVTAHSLSRSHRTILLLADGEHTVLDLARLSSKSVDEVAALLGDLETRGLVYYYD
jgi:hypothetical protein